MTLADEGIVERRDAPLCQSALRQHFSRCEAPEDLAMFLCRQGAFRWMHSTEELNLSESQLFDEKCAAVAEACQPLLRETDLDLLWPSSFGLGGTWWRC
eukprot:5304734-Amphidinium_carterae.2